MLVLFDNGVPWALRRSLHGHVVMSARRMGWHELRNGDLLRRAEDNGFDVLLTNDKHFRHQQNLSQRKLALVVLSHPQWPQVKRKTEQIAAAINACRPGDYVEVDIPFE